MTTSTNPACMAGQLTIDEYLAEVDPQPPKPTGRCLRLGRHDSDDRPDVFDGSGVCKGCQRLDEWAAVDSAEIGVEVAY